MKVNEKTEAEIQAEKEQKAESLRLLLLKKRRFIKAHCMKVD